MRVGAFFVWAAVAASVMFWLLRVGVGSTPLPLHAEPVAITSELRADVSRLFTTAAVAAAPDMPTEPALAARFALAGVMAPKNEQAQSSQGVALIAVDGKPARAYRVGARVDSSLVLQRVGARSAEIGPAGGMVAVRLDLPLLPEPSTGSLESAPGVEPASFAPGPPPSAATQRPPRRVREGNNANRAGNRPDASR